MPINSQFGAPYFEINLKSTQRDKQLTGGEEQTTPEMIAYSQMPFELQPYLGQEEMTGRNYNRPAITSGGAGNQPALTGGGTTGGTQGRSAMDYISQLAGPVAGIAGRALRLNQNIPSPTVPGTTSFNANAELYGDLEPWEMEPYPSSFEGSIYDQPQGRAISGGTNQAISNVSGTVGSMLPGLLGNQYANPAISYMGGQLGSMAGQLATTGTVGAPSLGMSLNTMFTGQSDFTNPYSSYIESIIGNIVPGLGTALAGIIEGIFGKGGTGPKENPQYTQARESGQARAKQLKDQGMTPYQIWQWANENGYAVNAGTQEPGTEGTGDVYTVYNPQEAMLIDQIESGMFGTQPQRPMQSDQGWYWGGEGQWSGWAPGSEWKVPEYHKSLEELLGKKSFTKAMSNIYEGDKDYLIGSPEKKTWVNPWQY